MLEGTWAAGAWAEEGEGSERRAGAAVAPLMEVGAAAAAAVVDVVVAAAAGLAAAEEVLVAAEGVWDGEALPCDWVEKAAEAWNCAKLWMHSPRKVRGNKTYN